MNPFSILIDASVDVTIRVGSAVDALIAILVIVGGVIGYKRGVIVECIGFFAVLVWLTICVNVAKWVHGELLPNSEVPDLFAIIIMTVLFIIGLVFLVSRVNFQTQLMLQSTMLGPSARYLGAFFGAAKYYMISAVFLVTLFKIEEYAKYLPNDAKFSALSRNSVYLITRVFPYLELNREETKPFEYPNNGANPNNNGGKN